MLRKILFGLLLLTLVSCNKQEDNSKLLSKYIQVDRVINTGCEFKGGARGFLISVDGDQISMRPLLTEKGLRINVYDAKKNTMRVEHYQFNQSILDTLQYFSYPLDLEVNKDNIFALFNKYILVIDKNNSKNTYLISLKEPFEKLKKFGNELILCRAYDFAPTSTKIPIRLAKYDLMNKKLINYVDLKSDAIEFSHFWPLNWLDISNTGDVVFTQAISPVQDIYDKGLNLIQKLGCKPSNWKNIDMSELNFLRRQKTDIVPQTIIDHLTKTDNAEGCRMISVNFANDSTLLVFYNGPSLDEKANFVHYCNIWKRKNDKWVLFDKELKDAYPDVSSTLSKGNFPLNGSVNRLRFDKDKVYYIDVTLDEKKLLQFGKKFSVVKDEMNRHFAEDKLYHQLLIYKCRF